MLQRVLHAPNTRMIKLGAGNPALQRGAVISALVHAAALALLLIALPKAQPADEPQDVGIAMVFDGNAASSIHAPAPGPIPAPANTTVSTPPPIAQPPKPQPIEATAPPPPPAPPTPPQPQATALALPTPPLPAPPPTPAPAISLPPPAPSPPAQTQQSLPTPPLPVPPPPTPTTQSTTQPSPTKNPAPESTALDNTLEKLRSLQSQTQPPRARHNPQSGGAPNTGGNPASDDTAGLTAAQRGAIGEYVRRCWSTDPGMLDLDKMSVLLTVTTDDSGMVRRAVVASEDLSRISGNERLRVFSERAVRAVMDPSCSNLPLPSAMLGQVRTFTFRFRP